MSIQTSTFEDLQKAHNDWVAAVGIEKNKLRVKVETIGVEVASQSFRPAIEEILRRKKFIINEERSTIEKLVINIDSSITFHYDVPRNDMFFTFQNARGDGGDIRMETIGEFEKML